MDQYRLAYSEQPTTLVRFVLRGDALQPFAINDALGVAPSAAWAKGDPLHVTRRPTGAWWLTSGGSRYQDFATQLNMLLDRLEALPSSLYELISTFSGTISVAYSADAGDFGGFHLDQSTMRRLCRLGVAIDFDLYPVLLEAESASPDAPDVP